MIIKSVARGRWGTLPETHTTWYQPFSEPEMIQSVVNFVLSQPVTGLCTAGDTRLLPLILDACDNFAQLSEAEEEKMIE